MKTQRNTSQKIFNFISRIERLASRAQGKGYGAGTIKQETALALKLLGCRPEIAIDIGGNIGNYTAELRRINSDTEIHIFEPSKLNLEKLTARFKTDSKIKITPCAVSNFSGEALLFSNEEGSGLGSLTKRNLDHFGIDFNQNEPVKIIKFEDYWEENLNQKLLDLVKIDIEGHELSALNGFGKALDYTKVVQFEFGGCNIDTKTYFQDFWYFFKQNNFCIYRITPIGLQEIDRYREADEFFSTTNYLAVNNQY